MQRYDVFTCTMYHVYVQRQASNLETNLRLLLLLIQTVGQQCAELPFFTVLSYFQHFPKPQIPQYGQVILFTFHLINLTDGDGFNSGVLSHLPQHASITTTNHKNLNAQSSVTIITVQPLVYGHHWDHLKCPGEKEVSIF